MQRLSRPSCAMRALAVLAAFVLGSGCHLSTDASVAQTAIMSGGNGQTGPVNTAFPNPLAVTVVDQYGFPMKNIQVAWTVRVGGGSVSATDTRTTEDGVSSVVFTAGPTAGVSTVTAVIPGVGTLNFTETAT
jgi:hypothetical protein